MSLYLRLGAAAAAAFSMCLALAAQGLAQTPPPGPPGAVPAAEITQARQTAKTFCTHWKAARFDSMYAMMSAVGNRDGG